MTRPRIMEDRASINVYLPRQQKAELIRMARENGESPSAFIRALIAEASANRAYSLRISRHG